MTVLERIRTYPRQFHRDARGALVKALRGDEPGLRAEVGEIYLVWAEPGQIRGGHYHPLTDEFFTLVEGRCRLLLADPVTGETAHIDLTAEMPVTVHVPKGIAHAFQNEPGAARFVLVAYADRRYEPADTVLFRFA